MMKGEMMEGEIVKYFYEEPVYLEALSAETDPDARRRAAPDLALDERSLDDLLHPADYYRGYLAGSTPTRTGLTALAHAESFVRPLLDVFDGATWTHADRDGGIREMTRDDVAPVLRDPVSTAVLVAGRAAPQDLATVADIERRYGIPALRRLLDATDAVLFPEPAHDGWDWSLFAAAPLKARLVAAFRQHPVEGVRRFLLPYQQARSEHKFYFERWTLGDLPGYVEEL